MKPDFKSISELISGHTNGAGELNLSAQRTQVLLDWLFAIEQFVNEEMAKIEAELTRSDKNEQ